MNRYFVEHPEMVLGTMQMESTRFGMDTACKADKEHSLSELLSEAVQRINGKSQHRKIRLMKSLMNRQSVFLPTLWYGIFLILWWMVRFTSEKMM